MVSHVTKLELMAQADIENGVSAESVAHLNAKVITLEGFSTRLKHTVEQRIHEKPIHQVTLNDIRAYDIEDFKKIRNFGKVTEKELKDFLDAHNGWLSDATSEKIDSKVMVVRNASPKKEFLRNIED